MNHLIKLNLVALLGIFSTGALAVGSGTITSGQGTITATSPQRTDIRQESQVLVTDWNNFDIRSGESVHAHQPNVNSKLLIRVEGNGPTNIGGEFHSNGVTIIQNQAGIEFWQGSVVNVGGLIATSGRVAVEPLARGDVIISNSTGAVVNRGVITANGKDVILAGARVENHGYITAIGSSVRLASGRDFDSNYDRGDFFTVMRETAYASVVNTGDITADGGNIEIESRGEGESRVSVGGDLYALHGRGYGYVYISGGDNGIVDISADIRAQAWTYVAGDYITITSDATIEASSVAIGGRNKGGLINYHYKELQPLARRILVEADARIEVAHSGYGHLSLWSSEKIWVAGSLIGGNIQVSAKGAQIGTRNGRPQYANEDNGIGYIDLGEISGLSISLYFNDLIISDEYLPAPILAQGIFSEHNTDSYTLYGGRLNSIGGSLNNKLLSNRKTGYLYFWAKSITIDTGTEVDDVYNLYLLANGDININSRVDTNGGNLAVSVFGAVNFGNGDNDAEEEIEARDTTNKEPIKEEEEIIRREIEEIEKKKETASVAQKAKEATRKAPVAPIKEPIRISGNRVSIFEGNDAPSEKKPSNRDIEITAKTNLDIGVSINAGRGNLELSVVDGGINLLNNRKTILKGNKVSISYTEANESGEYDGRRAYPLISENPNVLIEGASGVELNEPELAAPKLVKEPVKE